MILLPLTKCTKALFYYIFFNLKTDTQAGTRKRAKVAEYMANNNNNTSKANKVSNLNLARAAKKAAGNTFCGIVKSLYAYAETEEGKFLRSFLPKSKTEFLKRGEEVCKWGKVGETTTGKRPHVIKISADIILRFINNESKEKNAKKATPKAKKTTKGNKGNK